MNHFSKILSHSKWTLLSALVSLVLQLYLYYVIAQEVQPALLGSYFLASSFVFIPAGILEYSFVSSLIHSAHPSDNDYSTVFFINVALAVFFIVVGYSCVYLMEVYYATQNLTTIYLALMPILIIGSYTSIQNAGLKKNLRIKHHAVIELVSNVICLIATLVLLWLGKKIVALIGGQVVKYVAQFILLQVSKVSYLKINTRPTRNHFSQHWHYGKYVLAEKSLGIGSSYLDTFLVHHFLGPQVLGIYDLLKRMILRPIISAYNAIEQVVFPILSNAENAEDFRAAYKGFITIISFSLLALLGVFITPFLLRFLPNEYAAYDYVLQLIIFMAVSIIVFNPVDIVAYSLGQTKKYFNWIIVYSVVQVIVIIVALQLGLASFLIAVTLFNVVTYLLSYFVLVKHNTRLSFWEWGSLAWVFLGIFGVYCFVTG